MPLILNPSYKLRNEGNKILLYKVDWFGMMEKLQFIHPLYAILLSLFDGKKELESVEREFCYITNCSPFENGKRVIEEMLKVLREDKEEEILVDISTVDRDKIKIYEPESFIIERKKINFEDFRLSAPLDLNYNVTFKCNRRCIYCYAENQYAPPMQEISLVRLKEIIDEASKLKVNGIVFGGGEPFCRKDILEILEYTIKKGISCCVSTKKYLDKETCERLKEIGLEKIQVSIDSIKKEKANFMAGSNSFYDEILETIKNLQRVGIKVRIKAVVTSYNISDIPSLILSLKNDGILDFHIVCYGRSIYRHHDSIFASQDEIQKLKNSIDQIKRENPELNLAFGGMEEEKKMASEKEKRESFEKRAICSAGRSSLNILPDGRVTLCEQLPSRDEFCIGDLRKQSLLDIWNSDLLISFLRPERKRFIMTSCYDCEIFDDCNWVKGRCFRRTYQVFGSIFAPDPKCPKSGVNVRFS